MLALVAGFLNKQSAYQPTNISISSKCRRRKSHNLAVGFFCFQIKMLHLWKCIIMSNRKMSLSDIWRLTQRPPPPYLLFSLLSLASSVMLLKRKNLCNINIQIYFDSQQLSPSQLLPLSSFWPCTNFVDLSCFLFATLDTLHA